MNFLRRTLAICGGTSLVGQTAKKGGFDAMSASLLTPEARMSS
jgi:hypothetical protein